MEIKDVENLAELAKIELTEEEKKNIAQDMDGILNYVKIIETVEVADAPAKHDLINVWREDQVEERDFSKDLIVEQFPDQAERFLKVKKIL